MAVGADAVDVEHVDGAQFSGAQLKAANRRFGSESEGAALIGNVYHLVGESDGLVDFRASDVGRGAEIRVADNVKIGEAGDADSLAEAAPASALNMEEEIGVIAVAGVQAGAEVESFKERGFIFAGVAKAIFALIRRMEAGVGLKDRIRLAGNPPPGTVWVGEERKHWLRSFGWSGKGGIAALLRMIAWGRSRLLLRAKITRDRRAHQQREEHEVEAFCDHLRRLREKRKSKKSKRIADLLQRHQMTRIIGDPNSEGLLGIASLA
jgi:hypothetical protein